MGVPIEFIQDVLTYVSAQVVEVGLFVGDPLTTGVECASVYGYAREPVSMNSSGQSSGLLHWEAVGGNWGEVSHWAYFNSVGAIVIAGELSEPRDMIAGATLDVDAGDAIVIVQGL